VALKHAGLTWRTSSFSASAGSIKVASLPDGGVAVRNSRDLDGPVLEFTRAEWYAFLDGCKKGEFDGFLTG
jgi:uncharacterized protein DUF397